MTIDKKRVLELSRVVRGRGLWLGVLGSSYNAREKRMPARCLGRWCEARLLCGMCVDIHKVGLVG